MPYTLDDITRAEQARLEAKHGPGAAQRLVDEWNANEAAKPLREWRERMAESDAVVSRRVEDLFDALPDDVKAKVAEPTRTAIADKKALRASRP